MPITVAIDFLNEIFGNTYFFGSEYVIQIMIIIMTLAIITRQTEEWKSLAFPVCVGWLTVGIHINTMIYIVTIFMFVINELSMKTLSEAITGFRSAYGYVSKGYENVMRERTKIGRESLDLEKKAMEWGKESKKLKDETGHSKISELLAEFKQVKEERKRQKLKELAGEFERPSILDMFSRAEPTYKMPKIQYIPEERRKRKKKTKTKRRYD